MKVLHVISSGGMYGAEAVILNLSRALNCDGHESLLGVFSNSLDPNVQLHERAAIEGIRSHLISCKGQVDASVPRSIRELARSTGADLIHAHGYKADVYVSLAARSTRLPIVSTCHMWYDNDLAVRVYGAVDRWTLRGYTRVVAVSDEVRARLLASGVRSDRVRLIRNGIDPAPFDPIAQQQSVRQRDADALTVGLVGRLAQEKGVDLFLRAAARVLPEFPRTRFVVVGDGPDRADLEALIAELGIAQSAILLGRQDDMLSFYASLNVMVSSSRQEGLPIAILEGMACGLPLIATSVGAVSKAVEVGRTGFLIEPNDVSAIAAPLRQLLQSAELRVSMGQAARDRIAGEFSAERMAADYLTVYQGAIEDRRG